MQSNHKSAKLASPRPVRVLATVQCAYFLVTGLWPLVHIDSFLAVTGPKDDIWLVETVGVLVAAIGASLGLVAARGQVSAEIVTLAILSALGMGVIDAIYALRGRISTIYLLDALAEAVLVAAWAILHARRKFQSHRN
jgi:hypothetical protein